MLIESTGRKLFVLERAERAHSTYLRALQAGFEHLALLSASGLHERGIEYSAQQEAFPAQVEFVG